MEDKVMKEDAEKPIIEQFHAQGGPELLKGGIEAVRRRVGHAHGGAAAADARFD